MFYMIPATFGYLDAKPPRFIFTLRIIAPSSTLEFYPKYPSFYLYFPDCYTQTDCYIEGEFTINLQMICTANPLFGITIALFAYCIVLLFYAGCTLDNIHTP